MKKILLLGLVMSLLLTSTMSVMAKTDTKDKKGDLIDIVKISEDTYVHCYIEEEVITPTFNVSSTGLIRSSYSTVNKSVAMKFYVVSSGEDVARYGLSASFNYNGSDVYHTGSAAYATPLHPDWSTNKNFSNSQISPTYVVVNGIFELLHNGVHNNTAYIDIYCDQNGNITVYK